MTWTDAAFVKRMMDDGELAFQIHTYRGLPAVLNEMWIPPLDKADTPRKPYIITEGDTSYIRQNFKGTRYAEGFRDIRIYGVKASFAPAVTAVADRVVTLFSSDQLQSGEQMFPDAPINLIDSMAYGPMPAPTEGTFIGKRVRVRFRVEELTS